MPIQKLMFHDNQTFVFACTVNINNYHTDDLVLIGTKRLCELQQHEIRQGQNLPFALGIIISISKVN